MSKKSVFVVTSATPVDAETIRQAIESDPEFVKQPQFVRDGVLAMVPLIPAALAEWLDKPVTTEAMARAKFAFMRLCLDNGFVAKVVQAMPKAMLKRMGLTLEEFTEKMTGTLQMLVDGADGFTAQMVEAVKASGMTEGELIQCNTGLPEGVRVAEREGWLTVGKMLLLCPSSITQNDQ